MFGIPKEGYGFSSGKGHNERSFVFWCCILYDGGHLQMSVSSLLNFNIQLLSQTKCF
jgi:hypothetical protein